jgi:hypothetical protein
LANDKNFEITVKTKTPGKNLQAWKQITDRLGRESQKKLYAESHADDVRPTP